MNGAERYAEAEALLEIYRQGIKAIHEVEDVDEKVDALTTSFPALALVLTAAGAHASLSFARSPDDQSAPSLDAGEAVAVLDRLTADDPEKDHSIADAVLLDAVPPEVAAAYRRLVDRAGWWGA